MLLPSGDAFVSVVIPCLNEAEAIADVVRDVRSNGADEVIVVDNGSTDATALTASAAGEGTTWGMSRQYVWKLSI